jgi:diacylglycerol O-acyltransferase
VRFARRMSDTEALMWYLDKEPALRSTFSNLTILDRPPDVDRLRARLAKAVRLVPRLRQRVVNPPVRLAPPEWADDPGFDLDYHVRRLAVAAPGTDRQLFDLAALLGEDPLDRARPLWQFTVVEGLRGGRAALFQKMHHTFTDGEGGMRLSLMFLDLEREADEAARSDALGEDPEAEGPTGPLDVLRDTVVHRVQRRVRRTQQMASAAAGAAAHPTRIPTIAEGAVGTVRSLMRQALVTEPARSPLWIERSLRRRLDVLSVPLDETRRAAKALGGTVNDLFVTGVCGAAGAYHRAKGTPVDELRMAMPVSTRTDTSTGQNAFTPTRALVPAGEADPAARFEEVRRRLGTTKAEPAVRLAEDLAGVLGLLPTSVLVRFAQQQAQTVDFATSNVRGSPVELYIAGAQILANYAMGPTAGTAFNVTLLSYRGSLDMGVHIDTAAVDDPELLLRCLENSFAELLELGA